MSRTLNSCIRDEFCRHGDVLSSPALNYSLKQLSATVEAVRQEKLPKEQPEEDLENKDLAAPAAAVSDGMYMYSALLIVLIHSQSIHYLRARNEL